jgi:regulator of replication initiation timing
MSNEPSQFKIDLAAVLGCSAATNNTISRAINAAKTALSIDRHTRSLTDEDKIAIIRWHKARLTENNQVDIETIAPPVSCSVEAAPAVIEPVENPPYRSLEAELQAINAPLTELELLKLENERLKARLEAVDSKAAPTYRINEKVRLAVITPAKRERIQIALGGFYLNALMVAAGIDKKGVQAWIQAAVDGWGAFDDKLNVTEQVKLLIVRELEEKLIKARTER